MKIVKNLTKSNKTKLKDLCKVNLGQSPTSESYSQIKTDTPFFQGAADFTDKYTFIRNYTNAPKKQAYKNDLLMTVRAPAGRVNFANVNCAIGRGLCSFNFKDEALKNYMYFYLNNLYRKNGWSMDVQGAIFEAINKDQIEEKDITIDFETYGKISSFLSVIENRLITYKNLLEKIEIRNQYYADKLLSGEFSIENNTISKNTIILKEFILDEIVSKKITSGSTPKNITTELSETSYIKYYKVETLNEKLIEKYYITEKDDNIMSRSKLNENDILITIAGTLGRVVLVKSQDLPANINQAIAIIRVDETKCDKKYVYNFMKSIKEQIEKNKNDGAIQNLNLTTLSNFKIMLPDSILYQKEVSNFLENLNDEKEKVEKLLKLEEQRFEWLSDKLLSGEYIIED